MATAHPHPHRTAPHPPPLTARLHTHSAWAELEPTAAGPLSESPDNSLAIKVTEQKPASSPEAAAHPRQVPAERTRPSDRSIRPHREDAAFERRKITTRTLPVSSYADRSSMKFISHRRGV